MERYESGLLSEEKFPKNVEWQPIKSYSSYCNIFFHFQPTSNENKCSGTKPPLMDPPIPKKEVKFDLQSSLDSIQKKNQSCFNIRHFKRISKYKVLFKFSTIRHFRPFFQTDHKKILKQEIENGYLNSLFFVTESKIACKCF